MRPPATDHGRRLGGLERARPRRAGAQVVHEERDEQDVDGAHAKHRHGHAAKRRHERGGSGDEPQAVQDRASHATSPDRGGRRDLGQAGFAADPEHDGGETRNVAASTTKTGHAVPATPAITPVTPAPITPAIMRVICPSELAASRPSTGTTRGTSAVRAGSEEGADHGLGRGQDEHERHGSRQGRGDQPQDHHRAQRVRHDHDPAPARLAAKAPANRPMVTGEARRGSKAARGQPSSP